ncbi:NADPH-dependent FMN reductase [Clostridium sp. DL-VIII]|uniref:flavodoxin family protein n=1 Tax=Clostridium sp. DL-VIII TaxID=641107 RepID=UPI00023B003F|nr:flavodoxin family protein [Clostridium sp. DL-VIII]EHI99167.1 NADPH-dependent FMN reductase [Clostridium sp. DL-VIII]
MKVLLVNGSPHEKGCTYTAISEVADTLQKEGIDTDIFWIGKKPLSGCVACGGCKKIGKCVFNDTVNEFMKVATDYDGFIFGSPVHFAAMDGAMKSFMDRAFFSNMGREKNTFMLKPVAAVVSARRAGTTAALDQMNKYFTHGQMPIISSRYWNMVHGNSPEEVRQDDEGMQIMRVLGRNMAWFLKLVEAGEKLSVKRPKQEGKRISTNFIR